MRFLLCSAAVLMVSCTADYKGLQRYTPACDVMALRPGGMDTNWFTASVDVMGRHLSGLLLIKNTSEENYRVVFTNESGLTFFDFEFGNKGEFVIHRIMKQIDRKPVIALLRNDFALLLGKPFVSGEFALSAMGDEVFAGVTQKNETAYFITDRDCASLRRLETGSRRKRKVTIVFDGSHANPERIEIRHHTFNMVINLKKLAKQ